MNVRERFGAVMKFQPVDRMPVIEPYWWWDQTLDRWYAEGLPRNLTAHGDIAQYLGLDLHRIFWPGPDCRRLDEVGQDYEQAVTEPIRRFELDKAELERYAAEQADGRAFLWCQINGFFWFPRGIMGIERHLLGFYDEPDLMRRLNEDNLRFNLRLLEELFKICSPDMITFAEDLSYNHGPMLSKEQFDQFIAPCYRVIIPLLRKHNISIFMDTDGNVMDVIPWLKELGIEGLSPLERMAGTDVAEIRRHGRFRMIGGFDKTVMHRGEAAIRREFERLLPVMRSGGYIAATDHQTPPQVSLDDYRLYVRLLKEYAAAAGGDRRRES